jgi:hypothetical protein
METIESELHPDNMNREEGPSLSRTWKLIQTLKEQKKVHSKNTRLTSTTSAFIRASPTLTFLSLIPSLWSYSNASSFDLP